MKKYYFNVRPRYTPGSPGMIPEDLALKIVEQERRSFDHYLSGVHGPKNQEMAKEYGLRGIVEKIREKGSGRNRGWEVEDLLLQETYFRPIGGYFLKQGYQPYSDLQEWQKEKVSQRPPLQAGDYRSYGWFKVQVTRLEWWVFGVSEKEAL